MDKNSPRRRALLVGIDLYTPLRPGGTAPHQERGRANWFDLAGCARDVRAMAALLQESFGYLPEEIRVLLDREATRTAILAGIQELLAGAGPGDEVLFYYSGHGSQALNSLSDELDLMDESLVPADSYAGEPDIRDKELRRLFNSLLDHGVRLTAILDCSHSGSASRGLPSPGRRRQLPPDLRDVEDPPPYGARPEDRGALILTASVDDQSAWEEEDENGVCHGAFTRALLAAIRAVGPNAPVERLFIRTKVRLQATRAWQEPVLAGTRERRRATLLGGGGATTLPEDPPLAAIARIWEDGRRVTLVGGFDRYLRYGSQLYVRGSDDILLRVLPGNSDSGTVDAEVIAGDPSGLAVGALCELSRWNVDNEPSLTVWISEHECWEEARGFAVELALVAAAARVRWLSDPVAEEPGHVLSWEKNGWRLATPEGERVELGPAPTVEQVLERCATTGSTAGLFVQLPCPPEISRALRLGAGTSHDAINRANSSEEAHYILAGRLGPAGLEYAWVRPDVGPGDRAPLPPRSNWFVLPRAGGRGGGPAVLARPLEEAVLRIARIRAWLTLEAPQNQNFPYRLALRRLPDGKLSTGGELLQGETYGLVLHADPADLTRGIAPRYVYVFLIDSLGRINLLFPSSVRGGVECRFPSQQGGEPWPPEIPLGEQPAFTILPPLGVDTFFLLTTADPIPDPSVLETDAVRQRGPHGRTPLEELLSTRGGARRSADLLTPADWSLERLMFISQSVEG
jgi:Caspase domain